MTATMQSTVCSLARRAAGVAQITHPQVTP